MKKNAKNTNSDSKEGSRLGPLMRGRLADVYGARGHSTGKLWTQYSAKARRDVAFGTEIEYLHFLYLESSFDVQQVEYTPKIKIQRSVGCSFVEYVNAEFKLANGDVVWRHVCSSSQKSTAEQKRCQLQLLLQSCDMPDGAPTPQVEIITLEDILAVPQRIRNWHSIAAWLAAGRDWSLTEEQLKVAALIRRNKRVEFQTVLELGGGTERNDLYGVAIFRSLQTGAYSSNLFDAPFSMRTVFYEKLEAV